MALVCVAGLLLTAYGLWFWATSASPQNASPYGGIGDVMGVFLTIFGLIVAVGGFMAAWFLWRKRWPSDGFVQHPNDLAP
jgi:hypothetical protein